MQDSNLTWPQAKLHLILQGLAVRRYNWLDRWIFYWRHTMHMLQAGTLRIVTANDFTMPEFGAVDYTTRPYSVNCAPAPPPPETPPLEEPPPDNPTGGTGLRFPLKRSLNAWIPAERYSHQPGFIVGTRAWGYFGMGNPLSAAIHHEYRAQIDELRARALAGDRDAALELQALIESLQGADALITLTGTSDNGLAVATNEPGRWLVSTFVNAPEQANNPVDYTFRLHRNYSFYIQPVNSTGNFAGYDLMCEVRVAT